VLSALQWQSPTQAAGLPWPFQGRRAAAPRVSTTKEWTPRRGPVFDFKALTSTPLNARVLKRSVEDGIVTEEVMFHSETDGRRKIDIFAYFLYPRGARKLPAFVWIEGGLAPARTFRTVFGARRGYATLAIDFPQPGYRSTGNYPINRMMTVDENPAPVADLSWRRRLAEGGVISRVASASRCQSHSAWRAVRGVAFTPR
jgi:hypothetical protein